jgi:DNA-binding GntR family transcriptional regulator
LRTTLSTIVSTNARARDAAALLEQAIIMGEFRPRQRLVELELAER